MVNVEDIKKAEEASDARYKIDYMGILYTSVYSAITSISGGAVMQWVGVLNAGGVPLAVFLVFVTQLVPKIAKELDKQHKMNQAREEAYMSGMLESRKPNTDNILHLLLSGVGRCSAF